MPISDPVDISAFLESPNSETIMVMYQVLDDTRCNYVIRNGDDINGDVATSSVESGTLHIGKFTGFSQADDDGIREAVFDVRYELIPNGDRNQKFKKVSSVQFRTIVPSSDEDDWGIRLYDLRDVGKEMEINDIDPDQAVANILGSQKNFRSLFTTYFDTTTSFISSANKQFVKLLRSKGEIDLANIIERQQLPATPPVLLYDIKTSKFTQSSCRSFVGNVITLCSATVGAAVGSVLSPWVIIPAALGLGAVARYQNYMNMKLGAEKRAEKFRNSQVPRWGSIKKPTTTHLRKNALVAQLLAGLFTPPTGGPPLSNHAQAGLTKNYKETANRLFQSKLNKGGKTKHRKQNKSLKKSNSRKYGKYKHKRMSRAKSSRQK
jgi:hypothetical protein